MVAPISVFPDVGGAFFGSYRGARQARLQEAAMRAEMAAAQADRQRQAQARESFARLQGPDQVVGQELTAEQTGLASQFFGMPRLDVQERVVREGLTPEQRAREEQRLAQADPSLFAASRQMQAGPETRDYSPILEALPQQLQGAQSPEDQARILNRAHRVAQTSYGYQGSPDDLANEALAMFVPQASDQVNGIVVQTEQGQVLVNPRTGEPIAEYGARPTSTPRPTGRDQRIASLVQQGLDYNTAANVVDRVVTVESDPVTGQPRLVNVATGEVTPLGGAASGGESGDGGDSNIPTRTLWENTAGVAGFVGQATEAYGRVAGQLPGVDLGETVDQVQENRQMFRTASNELVRALSVNSRFPVAEQERIRQEINVQPTAFDSEASLRTRMRSIDRSLRARAEEELRASQDENLPVTERRNARRAYSDITRFLRTMGVPQGGGREGDTDSGEVVYEIRNGRLVRAGD